MRVAPRSLVAARPRRPAAAGRRQRPRDRRRARRARRAGRAAHRLGAAVARAHALDRRRERVHRGTLAGVAVGFCGLGLLLLPGSRPAEATAGGILLVLVAAGSWATGSFLSPRLSMPSDPLVSTGWQMVVGGGALLVGALATGEANDLHLARRLRQVAARLRLPGARGLARGVHRLRMAAAERADLEGRNLRVRQSARRRPARLGAPERAAHRRHAAGAALIVASVAAIVRRESPRPGRRPRARPRFPRPSPLPSEERCIKQPAVVDSVS